MSPVPDVPTVLLVIRQTRESDVRVDSAQQHTADGLQEAADAAPPGATAATSVMSRCLTPELWFGLKYRL